MDPNPSNRWPDVTLDLPGKSLRPASPDKALRRAEAAEQGTLGGTGEAGDCVELQFNGDHAAVFYMRPDLTILRPRFPNRAVTGDGVEESFCECCGVQLGDRAVMLSRCASRAEGFLLCRAILSGHLPDAVPAGVVGWVVLRPRRPAHAH